MPLPDPPTGPILTDDRQVLICLNRTCRKQGSREVLQAFQDHPVEPYTVIDTGCLGQCGNGPIVRVLPDDVWYCRVLPEEVPAIVERHLRRGKPIAAMLCPHPPRTPHPTEH